MSMRVGKNDVVGKSGKKSKRSKKVEMDGVEEISDRADVELDGLGGIGKKSNKSKKKEMDEAEEINDRTDLEVVELVQNLESRVEKKKKTNRGKDMVAGDESGNRESFGQFDIDNQLKKVKKKKKKKTEYNIVAGEEFVSSEIFGNFDVDNQLEKVKKEKDKRMSVSGEEVTYCLELDAVTTEEASSLSLNKREKRLKYEIEDEVLIDSSLNDSQDEDKTVKKRKKKKTKRRKFDTSVNPDALNEKTVTEARESNNVVRNVEKKKKKKRKRTAEEENDNDEGQENLAGEKMLKIL